MANNLTYEELEQRVKELEKELAERKLWEKALRESERGFRALAEHIPDIIARLDKQLRHLYVNPAVEAVTGIPSQDFIGKTNEQLGMPQDLCALWREIVQKVFHTGKMESVEFDFPTSHETRSFHLLAVPEYSQDGAVVSVISIARDITEHKRAEVALRESEESYRDLYENAPNAYFSISAVDGSIRRCNSAALQLLGYEKEDLAEMKVFDLYADTHHGKPKATEVFRHFQAGESIRDVELQMKAKDGQNIWVSLSVEPMRDRHGKVIGSRSMAINISDRKWAEEALQESEEKYRSMMEAMNDSVYICSPNLRVTFMNPAMIRRIGHDATGEPCHNAIYGLDEKCPWCVHENIQHGQRLETEVLSPKDHRSYHISHSPIFHVDGSISKMTIFRDITELKRAEEELRKASDELEQRVEERTAELSKANLLLGQEITERVRAEKALHQTKRLLESTLASLADAVFVVEPSSRKIIACNPALERVFGYSEKEAIGRNTEFLHVNRNMYEQFGRELLHALDTKGVYHTEYQLQRKDGSVFASENTVTAIVDDSGNRTGLVSFVRDITVRKKAEEALRRLEEQRRYLSTRLLEAQETERRYVANELHDNVGSSLAGIKMALELKLKAMQEGAGTSEAIDLETIIARAKEVMEETKRIQKNLRPLVLDNLGLIPAIRSLCREFEQTHPDIAITPNLELDEEVSESLRIAIYRICQEALNNIARHSGAKEASLSLTKRSSNIELVVSDEGHGFDTEKALKAGEVHQGIGLFSMKERCELAGGSFSLVSSIGEGTTVSACWPCT